MKFKLVESYDTYSYSDQEKRFWRKNGYAWKTININDIIEQNGILKDNSTLSRRENVWGDSYDKYELNQDKMRYSEPIRISANGRVLDGHHRLVALKNAGYKNVEVLMKESLSEDLSDTQKRFFQDSKIRDGSGNLLVCYHASNSNFTAFSKDKIGSGNGGANFGKGFYFTPNKRLASGYGNNVREFYLNITNPFDYYNVSLEDFQKMVHMAGMPIDHNIFDKVTEEDLWDCDLIELFVNCLGYEQKAYRMFDNIIRELGYDGIIAEDEIVAFEPNQIKLVSNLVPTTSDDITEEL